MICEICQVSRSRIGRNFDHYIGLSNLVDFLLLGGLPVFMLKPYDTGQQETEFLSFASDLLIYEFEGFGWDFVMKSSCKGFLKVVEG